MSPSARSKASPSTAPATGEEARSSRVEASAPTASASAPPTARRAEIATTRPHGDRRIDARAYLRSRPRGQDRSANVSGHAQAHAPAVRAPPALAVQLRAALSEQQGGAGAVAQRVGDQVAVVHRERRPQLVADL